MAENAKEVIESTPAKWISCRDAADRYGGSPSVWRRLAIQGSCDASRPGGHKLWIRLQDIERHLAMRAVRLPEITT